MCFFISSINALFSDPFLDKYQSYLKVDAQLIKRRCTVSAETPIFNTYCRETLLNQHFMILTPYGDTCANNGEINI